MSESKTRKNVYLLAHALMYSAVETEDNVVNVSDVAEELFGNGSALPSHRTALSTMGYIVGKGRGGSQINMTEFSFADLDRVMGVAALITKTRNERYQQKVKAKKFTKAKPVS